MLTFSRSLDKEIYAICPQYHFGGQEITITFIKIQFWPKVSKLLQPTLVSPILKNFLDTTIKARLRILDVLSSWTTNEMSYLPPYSTFLNPTEEVFFKLEKQSKYLQVGKEIRVIQLHVGWVSNYHLRRLGWLEPSHEYQYYRVLQSKP
ncbi:hypothetical protein RF11_11938 [Thelohanellus kitauei]|uniref:Uncharacterized protein n=1 Tax=Thelohanellus kitauei TaxID=669202 RepID=A0A0C2MX12_THEKT|nr:hypothetical protein RF11_11938 [Thelohanellus kitauei]